MDEIKRLQQLAEIKVNSPANLPKMSLDIFKKIVFEGWKNIVIELFDEDIQDNAITDFEDNVMNINNKYDFCEKAQSFFDEYGFGEDQLIVTLINVLVK
jgi:hypothetical protein